MDKPTKPIRVPRGPKRKKGELLFMGIDPGVTGAFAIIGCVAHSQEWRVLYVGDIPTEGIERNNKTVNRVSAKELAKMLKPWARHCDLITVEKIFAPPGIMSTVAFSLGYTAGAIDSALDACGIGLTHKRRRDILPKTWKGAMRLPQDKEASRVLATAVVGQEEADKHWPLKKHHNRAEAALLAIYSAMYVPKEWKAQSKEHAEEVAHAAKQQQLAAAIPDTPA